MLLEVSKVAAVRESPTGRCASGSAGPCDPASGRTCKMRRVRTARWLLTLLGLVGCAGPFAGAVRPDGKPALFALLINGGGTVSFNYLSHLHHLADMHGVLRERGVPPQLISVLASDGDSPTADVAAAHTATGGQAWLLQGTVLER